MDSLPYTDAELQAIKEVFAGAEETLIALRKTLLQMELSDSQVAIINGMDDNVKSIIKKTLLPEIDGDARSGSSLVDLWMTIQLENQDPLMVFATRKLLINRIKEGLDRLNDITKMGESIEFDFDEKKYDDIEEVQKKLTARNMYINHINQNIFRFKILAGEKTETVDALKERLAKNSTK